LNFKGKFKQVAPVAIISRSELLRFTFNPFRVGAYPPTFPTGCTCGYSNSTPIGVEELCYCFVLHLIGKRYITNRLF